MVQRENEANHVPGTGKAPSVLLVPVLVPVPVLVKSIHRRQKIIWQQSGSIPDNPETKKRPRFFCYAPAGVNALNPDK